MVMQAIFLAAVIVIMVFLLVMMWTIYGGMKEFLRDNVREVIIASGECIIDRVQNLHGAMSTHINALETGNMTLRNEITRRLDALSDIIADSGGKSETGVNSIVNELNNIISTLRDEMKEMADTLSQNSESFQKSTISNLEAEIRKLIMAVKSLCGDVTKSANEQSKILAEMAGTVQGVMREGVWNLQSEFGKTHAEIRNIITDSVKKIDDDYQQNMTRIFQAMADNLSAIIQQLRTAGAEVVLPTPANTADILPESQNIAAKLEAAEPAQEKPRRGRPRKNPPEVTDTAKKEAGNNAA